MDHHFSGQLKRLLFLDAEFTGLHQNTSLISLALVADTGEEFYTECTDYDKNQVTPWIADHIISNLFLHEERKVSDNGRQIYVKGTKKDIRMALESWLEQFGKEEDSIQIWGDCHPWDWVLFCELFGGAFGIPESIHYMPLDLATLFHLKAGNPDMDREEFVGEFTSQTDLKKHNALYDARMAKACFQKLIMMATYI